MVGDHELRADDAAVGRFRRDDVGAVLQPRDHAEDAPAGLLREQGGVVGAVAVDLESRGNDEARRPDLDEGRAAADEVGPVGQGCDRHAAGRRDVRVVIAPSAGGQDERCECASGCSHQKALDVHGLSPK